MENGYSFHCRLFPHIISFLLTYERNLIFISPWITDIEIPILSRKVESYFKTSETNLSQLLKYYSKEKNITIITRDDKINYLFLNRLRNTSINIIKLENLHVKYIVGENFVYTGSANITYQGTEKNIENCSLGRNLKRDIKEYIKEYIPSLYMIIRDMI